MKSLRGRAGRARKPRTVDKEKERHWREVFVRFQRSELPFREFCARENISPNTFQYWRRELRKRDELHGITSVISKGDNRPSKLQQNIDYWLAIINEINVFEGSINGYCRTRGISSGSLHFWEKRLKEMKLTNGVRKDKQTPGAMFVPVRILGDCAQLPEEGTTADAAMQRIEFKLSNGMAMFLPASTDVETLIQFVNGVKDVQS
jgi:transposase-like protein